MQIEMQALDFTLTQALRSHLKRRLDFALSTRYDQIQRIQVRLSDINGPRGGADKCCQIHIVLPRQSDVVIQDTETDMYAAINRATERASRTINRRLARDRHRSIRNHPGQLVPEMDKQTDSLS